MESILKKLRIFPEDGGQLTSHKNPHYKEISGVPKWVGLMYLLQEFGGGAKPVLSFGLIPCPERGINHSIDPPPIGNEMKYFAVATEAEALFGRNLQLDEANFRVQSEYVVLEIDKARATVFQKQCQENAESVRILLDKGGLTMTIQFFSLIRVPALGLLTLLLVSLFSAGQCDAGPQIHWIDKHVESFPTKEARAANPNNFPGEMVYFGKTLSEDDLVLIGKVRRNTPKYFRTWYNFATIEIVEVLYGQCDTDTVNCLSLNTFIPTSRKRFLVASTIDGPGWLIPGDYVLVALRTEKINPFTKGMYHESVVRYLKESPYSKEQISYIQYGEPEFDYEGYNLSVDKALETDPYCFLGITRARGAGLKEDIDVLLGKEGK